MMLRNNRRLGRIVFIVAFLGAVYGLSRVLETLRAGSLGELVLWLLLLAASVIACGFFMYADENTKGNVRKRIGLYDRILAWQAEGKAKGTS